MSCAVFQFIGDELHVTERHFCSFLRAGPFSNTLADTVACSIVYLTLSIDRGLVGHGWFYERQYVGHNMCSMHERWAREANLTFTNFLMFDD